MNMGSKTKTYTNLSASRMFEEDDNLYMEEIIRIFAQTESIASDVVMPIVLNDANTFFNEAIFEKFGATSDFDMQIVTMKDGSVLNYVQTNIEPTATELYGYFTGDADDVYVKDSILKVRDSISQLTTDDSCTQRFYQTLNDNGTVHQYSVDYPMYVKDDMTYVVKSKNEGNDVVPLVD